MLPQSARTPSRSATRRAFQGSLARLQPANIVLQRSLEMRALVRWLAVLGVLGVIIALGYVWLRLQVVDLGYRLSATRAVIRKLEREGRDLAAEVAMLTAAARIEDIAIQRLGMVRPNKNQEVALP